MKFLFWNSKYTISKKLKKEGFKVLNNRHWDRLAEIYKSQPRNPKFIKTKSRWYEDADLAGKLKKRCQEVLKLEYRSNKDIYVQAKKWCVVPHPMKDRAKYLGFSFLNMDENLEADREIWEMRIMYYKPLNNEVNLKYIIGDVNQIDFVTPDQKIKLLKKEARKIINTMNYDENSELCWNTTIRWFVKERP